jgi:hypothetical protein
MLAPCRSAATQSHITGRQVSPTSPLHISGLGVSRSRWVPLALRCATTKGGIHRSAKNQPYSLGIVLETNAANSGTVALRISRS